MPRNNQEFWAKKLQKNKDRDKFVKKELHKLGWTVIRVWEHELRDPAKVAKKLQRILDRFRPVEEGPSEAALG